MKVLNSLYFGAKNAISRFIKDEQGDVNVVSIVLLIGVAVLLAIIFKGSITKLIEGMLTRISSKASSVI